MTGETTCGDVCCKGSCNFEGTGCVTVEDIENHVKNVCEADLKWFYSEDCFYAPIPEKCKNNACNCVDFGSGDFFDALDCADEVENGTGVAQSAWIWLDCGKECFYGNSFDVVYCNRSDGGISILSASY